MKREIKFRCWTGDEMLYEGWNKEYFVNKAMIFRYDLVMQFIGITDINGKEIYEGDICKNFDENGVVTAGWYELYKTGIPCFNVGHKVIGCLQNGQGFEVEIIGNIYETKDYLNLL